ncbi:MAG: SIMPL domain-containing protein [Saprospiraceae bacterium]|nr:SIMPL domain-containing protein [Saprospiraceae bacterium]
MKTLKTLSILMIVMMCSSIYAQADLKSIDDKPYIEVIGTVEKKIIPDEIYITMTLIERQEGKDKITIEMQEKALKDSLNVLGIDLENLYLSDAISNYSRVKWSKKDIIATTQYILKVDNAKTVGQVFEKLDELEIKNAKISKVDHSKIIEYKKECRIFAIKAAKEKADYLLEAIGEKTGKPIKIYEVSNNVSTSGLYSNANYISNNSYREYNSSREDMTEIQFNKIVITSSIYVKFEIK